MKRITTVALFTAAMITMVSSPSFAQEKKQDAKKQAKVIVKMKGDGKVMNIDTTFNLANPKDEAAFEKYMKDVEINMENVNDQMKNMNITVEAEGFDDSIASDSIHAKVICIGKEGKGMRYVVKTNPHDCDFKFDMPCNPDNCNPYFYNFHWTPEERCMTGDKQTLGDLLGDIPMDRVKSYKIQDKKNGKRIIIDIEDAPLLEQQEKVVVIRR